MEHPRYIAISFFLVPVFVWAEIQTTRPRDEVLTSIKIEALRSHVYTPQKVDRNNPKQQLVLMDTPLLIEL